MANRPKQVVESGAADLAELAQIDRARPRGTAVREAARRISGVEVREAADGTWTATSRRGDLKASRALAHLLDAPRQLEMERAERLIERRPVELVRNAAGQVVPISGYSLEEAAERNLIHATSTVFTRGLPRCQRPGGTCDHRENGRCWWCGRSDAGQ